MTPTPTRPPRPVPPSPPPVVDDNGGAPVVASVDAAVDDAAVAAEPVVIHTDGACKYNPGPGGWGAVLRWKNKERHLRGGALETTNNRMELTAAIRALEALSRPMRVELYTDSKYVRDGITEWLPKWKQNNRLLGGLSRKKGKKVANADLWKRLDEIASKHDIAWKWVKGHAGHPDNELADALANEGVELARAGEAE